MRGLAIFVACLWCGVARAADEVRTWTDTTGRSMQAQFIREVDGDVTFLKDGKLFTFALDKLSEKDQKLIRELESEKKVEENTPPVGAPRKEPATEAITGAQEKKTSTNGGERPPLTAKRQTAENRTWRDRFGKQTSGRFVRVHDGNVILSRSGRMVPMPFADLSRGDQDYVREFLTARGEGHLVPDARGAAGLAAENAVGAGLPAGDGQPVAAAPVGPPMPGPAIPGPPMGGGRGGGGFPPGMGGGNLANNPAAEAMERMQERNRQQMEQARERSRQQAEEMQARNQQRTEEMQKRNEESAQRMAALHEQQMAGMQRLAKARQDAMNNQIVAECGSCKKDLTREQSEMKQCPHCNVVWTHEVDVFGNRREIPGAVALAERQQPPGANGQQANAGWDFNLTERQKYRLIFRIIIPSIIALAAVIGGWAARNR